MFIGVTPLRYNNIKKSRTTIIFADVYVLSRL